MAKKPPDDPWGDQGYSSDKYYMDSSDERGHSVTITMNIPPELAARLAKIVESKMWPHRSKGDIGRDALNHRLKYLEDHAPDPDTDLQLRIYLSKERRRMRQVMLREQMLLSTEIEAGLKGAVGNMAALRQEIAEAQEDLLALPVELRGHIQELIEDAKADLEVMVRRARKESVNEPV